MENSAIAFVNVGTRLLYDSNGSANRRECLCVCFTRLGKNCKRLCRDPHVLFSNPRIQPRKSGLLEERRRRWEELLNHTRNKGGKFQLHFLFIYFWCHEYPESLMRKQKEFGEGQWWVFHINVRLDWKRINSSAAEGSLRTCTHTIWWVFPG